MRHAVTGADYGTVRTAAFMGYRMIADRGRIGRARVEGRVEIDDPIWHGYLANLSPAEFESRYEAILPERMRGADFLEWYNGITDSVTRVQPDRDYPVRQATAHPIYEQARVERFATLLGELRERSVGCARTRAPDVRVARELQRVWARQRGHRSPRGDGGAGGRAMDCSAPRSPVAGAAELSRSSARSTQRIVVREIAAAYSRESGRVADVFAESGPGAEERGVESDRAAAIPRCARDDR